MKGFPNSSEIDPKAKTGFDFFLCAAFQGRDLHSDRLEEANK